MATIKDELYLNYDGVNSKDFGLIAVELGSGLYEETLVTNRTIMKQSQLKDNSQFFIT